WTRSAQWWWLANIVRTTRFEPGQTSETSRSSIRPKGVPFASNWMRMNFESSVSWKDRRGYFASKAFTRRIGRKAFRPFFVSRSCKNVWRDGYLRVMNSEPSLTRRLGLFSLIVYGVGDMVGAGIYGTIGVAAGLMGNTVWLAFVISMVAAMLTGLSYASLASRYPKAGGAAYITHRAYKKAYLSYVVGLSVTVSGLTSMAAGAHVFAPT